MDKRKDTEKPPLEDKNSCKSLIDPDRDLTCWEKWIVIRKEEAEYLASRTQRPAADLTMNLLEQERADKERKTALEYAQIKKKPKIRGKTLWEQPQRLYQYCECEPVYEIQRTQAELGRPPVIEHIGVPKYIQVTEKGVIGIPTRQPCTLLDADYVKYREKREKELKKKIKRIDPFRPQISDLMVKGEKAIKPPGKKLPPLPEITIDAPTPEKNFVDSIYAVRINNSVICKDIPGQNTYYIQQMKLQNGNERCTSWTYYFNVPVSRAGRSKLFLKNLGTVTLRYCWKKIRRPIPFIPEDFYTQVFFFNKNEDVISPGQSKELFFTFISDQPGIYSEFWELFFCNICFFDTLADKFIINLCADSLENIDKTLRKTELLKSRINRKALYSKMKSIVEEVLEKATALEPQVYPYKKFFLEAETFVMKNPICFYHQTEVNKMKHTYLEMAPGEQWDLSVAKWREVMMQKEFDERTMYYEQLRKSYSDLLKPWYEGDDLLKNKYQAVKWLLGQLVDKFGPVREYIYDSLDLTQDSQDDSNNAPQSDQIFDIMDSDVMRMANLLFYTQIQEHVAIAMEAIAGVLSSIDLNRWIEFDFCRL